MAVDSIGNQALRADQEIPTSERDRVSIGGVLEMEEEEIDQFMTMNQVTGGPMDTQAIGLRLQLRRMVQKGQVTTEGAIDLLGKAELRNSNHSTSGQPISKNLQKGSVLGEDRQRTRICWEIRRLWDA